MLKACEDQPTNLPKDSGWLDQLKSTHISFEILTSGKAQSHYALLSPCSVFTSTPLLFSSVCFWPHPLSLMYHSLHCLCHTYKPIHVCRVVF